MFGWKTTAQRAPHLSAETHASDAVETGVTAHGILRGTRLATHRGWCRIEALRVGDKVLTFDHGMQPVRDISRTVMFTDATSVPEQLLPVTVPSGALGNRTPMHVLAGQGVLVESDAALDAFGDPFAVVPAEALIGFRGIHRDTVPAQIEVITLSFSASEVIYVEGGALIYCPPSRVDLADLIDPPRLAYDVLTLEQAEVLVAHMEAEDVSEPVPELLYA